MLEDNVQNSPEDTLTQILGIQQEQIINRNYTNDLQSYLKTHLHENSHHHQQTETLVICNDISNFQTFNKDKITYNKQQSDEKQNIQNKKRLRLWSTGLNKNQANIKNSVSNKKKNNLVMISRKPALNKQEKSDPSNIIKINRKQNSQLETSSGRQFATKQIQSIEKKQITATHESGSSPSKQHSNQCPCSEFDKLLEITSRCVDYYNNFVSEKDQEIRVVRQAFQQIQGNLCSAFESIIDQIKIKQSQIVNFLHKKQKQLLIIKQQQEQNLKIGLSQIRSIHLSNFLRRNGGLTDQDRQSILSLQQSLQNSKSVINQRSISEDIHNYAKTLHNFYVAMEDIQKNCFKENVDQTINFINNLISQQIKFIVYEKIPQKSMNCSFSFNNNSIQSGRFANQPKRSVIPYFQNMNNFSLSSPSIATNLQFSEPTSPKGNLLRIDSLKVFHQSKISKQIKKFSQVSIQTVQETGNKNQIIIDQITTRQMRLSNKLQFYEEKIKQKNVEFSLI